MDVSQIERLPKVIEFVGKSYSLGIFVTAWNNLCVSYSDISNPHGNRIFSTVVCPDQYEKLSMVPEEISTVTSLEAAIKHIRTCIKPLKHEY